MKLELDNNPVQNYSPSANANVETDSSAEEIKKALRSGIKFAKEGNRAEARQMLLSVTEADQNNETAWLWLASISEYPEELLIFLQNVLKINPENERAIEWSKQTKSLLSKTFVQRGINASHANQKEFAKQCFMQGIVHDNENEMAWLWLASTADTQEDKLSHLHRVLQLNPQNETALSSLGAVKNQISQANLKKANAAAISGDHTAAKQLLDSILKSTPNMDEAWILKAFLANDFYEKISCYERALEINPSNEAAQAGLNSLQVLVGKAANPAEEEQNEVVSEVSQEAAEEAVQEIPEALSFEETQAPEVESHEIEQYAKPDLYSYQGNLAAAQQEEAEPSDHPTQDLDPDFVQSVEPAFRKNEFDSEMEAAMHTTDPDVTDEFSQQATDFPEPAEMVEFHSQPISQPEVVKDFQEIYTDRDFPQQTLNSDSLSGTPEELYDHDRPNVAVSAVEFTPVEESPAAEESQPEPVLVAEPQPVQPASMLCAFCVAENDSQALTCKYCRCVVSLSDPEMILANHEVNQDVVLRAIERMESEKNSGHINADELQNLGIAHLNVKNFRTGLSYLLEASRLNPNDVVLSSKIHTLEIRLNEIEAQDQKAQENPVRGKTILVVDDSPTVRKLISGKLEKCGHSVIAAVDGMDALAKINEVIPDLVLLDITMPRLDGYQVCKLIRNNEVTKDVPIVMISGKDGFFDKVRGRMAGSSGYITKPFGPDILMRTIESYLD